MGAMPDRGLHIRQAVPADAERIYELKCAVFGASYLPFTIFQSPESVSYLRELIVSADPHAFFVLQNGSEVCGYYDGYPLDETVWFLAYIAVCEGWRGRGFGDALLRHFEAEGRRRGRMEGALDVFASNPTALRWYERYGYTTVGRRAYLRARLILFESHDARELQLPEEPLRQALEAERRRGFSKVDALCGSARLCVGFIGGDTVNLLSCEGMGLADAAHALTARFRDTREKLILSGSEEELRPLPGDMREVALRLLRRWAP
jgi:ribosomal protein S18 acetylase RimI-like enzyme